MTMPGSKTQTTEKAESVESSLVTLFHSLIPLVLTKIGHDLIGSLEKSGKFSTLVAGTADSLNEGGYAGLPVLSPLSQAAAAQLVTPELMHGTVDKLQSLMDERFIKVFIREFRREFGGQAKDSSMKLENLANDFLDVCTDWLAFGKGKSFQEFLTKPQNNKPQFLKILVLVRSTLVQIIVSQRNNRNITAILQQIMPDALRAFGIGKYIDYAVQPETLRLFVQGLITEVFKTIFTPEALTDRPTVTDKNNTANKAKTVEKDDSEEKFKQVEQLESAFVKTAVAFKPLVVAAAKQAVTPERLPQLRENILNVVGKFKKANWVINKLFLPYFGSKEKIGQMIDRIANAFDEELCNRILKDIPAEKRINFINLLQQFLGNSVSNALGVTYDGGLINNINASELINEMLNAIKNLKPKDWVKILSVAFPNWIERKAAHFFLSYLSGGDILTEIIENVAGELNKRLDPELGGCLQNMQNFNARLHAANQKNVTPEVRQQLVVTFDKVCEGAAKANKVIQQRLVRIEDEIDQQNKQLNSQIATTIQNATDASNLESTQAHAIPAATATLQNNIKNLEQEKVKLNAANELIKPLGDESKAALMRQTLLQGDRLQLQQLANKLDKIAGKLVSLLKEITGNTFLEKVRAWFMTKEDAHSYLTAQNESRYEVERHQANSLQSSTLKALTAISKKLAHHSNRLDTRSSALKAHKDMQETTIEIDIALFKLFKAANELRSSDNEKIKTMAKDLTASAAPYCYRKI